MSLNRVHTSTPRVHMMRSWYPGSMSASPPVLEMIRQAHNVTPSRGRRSGRTTVLLAQAEDTADPKALQLPLLTIEPASPPVASRTPKRLSALASAASLLSIAFAHFGLKKVFLRAGLKFPPSLAGMVLLFAGLVALERGAPEAAENTVNLLEPGSDLLSRWLPVFFAPSLVVLPLSPAPSITNDIKLLLIIFGGWFVSLASTATVVSSLSSPVPATQATFTTVAATTAQNPVEVATPAFSASLIQRLGIGATLSGALAVVSASVVSPAATGGLARPVAQLSLLLTTLFSFTAGTRVPRKISRWIHPVVTCTAVTMAAAAGIGRVLGLGFSDMLRAYVTKSRCPVHLGAGDILLGLLGPSVLSFAVQMYRERVLIFKNAKQIAGASIFAASSGLFGTAIVSRSLGLPEALRLASLSRNITSPLAMAICAMLAADASFAIAIVVMTGVIGANFGPTALDALGIKDPAARGLAQGSSAHGLGTAAMVNEPTAFAFSAVAMALTATVSTVLVSIPAVKKALLTVALGASGVLQTP
ncbi:unnamed protein product [Ascophyllum nodosum]